MASYFGTSINESPTIVLPAAEKIENAQAIALVIKEGGLAKPTAGAMPIGLTLRAAEETYEKGDDVTVQVKDIGKWKAGEAIAVGDLLTTKCGRMRRESDIRKLHHGNRIVCHRKRRNDDCSADH